MNLKIPEIWEAHMWIQLCTQAFWQKQDFEAYIKIKLPLCSVTKSILNITALFKWSQKFKLAHIKLFPSLKLSNPVFIAKHMAADEMQLSVTF